MKKALLQSTLLILVIWGGQVSAQVNDSKVVLITLDGFRWQELFSGADPLLISNKKYVQDISGLKERFWEGDPVKRREILMPFLWTEVTKMGRLHGNRNLGSKVDLTNKMWFSYPGYNEILTGIADDIRITSNDKIDNPNKTILELVNNRPEYEGKVAAFGSWDVFPFIINENRSKVPVNAGFEAAEGDGLTEREIFLNELQLVVPSPWSSVRLDAFTYNYALEYMKKKHPRLVYIALGETDDFAHGGDYGAYLTSAHNADLLIKGLWNFTQQDQFYKDKTVFIITTDHGRGTKPLKTWKSHGEEVKGAGSVWMVLFGNGITPEGEISEKEQLYSNQIAPTILKAFDIKTEMNDMQGLPLKFQ